jgi:hypothetical protein
MMAIRRTALRMAALAVVGLLAGAGSANAQTAKHVDRVVVKLQRDLRDLHREVDRHFRDTRRYRELDRHVVEMEQAAAHIHKVLHEGGGRRHLREDVRKLDRLFHHVEEVVDEIAERGRVDRRTVRHIREMMRQVGSSLHHLKEDLD